MNEGCTGCERRRSVANATGRKKQSGLTAASISVPSCPRAQHVDVRNATCRSADSGSHHGRKCELCEAVVGSERPYADVVAECSCSRLSVYVVVCAVLEHACCCSKRAAPAVCCDAVWSVWCGVM